MTRRLSKEYWMRSKTFPKGTPEKEEKSSGPASQGNSFTPIRQRLTVVSKWKAAATTEDSGSAMTAMRRAEKKELWRWRLAGAKAPEVSGGSAVTMSASVKGAHAQGLR